EAVHTRPDAAFGDGADVFDGEVAALGNAVHEQLVDGGHLGADGIASRRVPLGQRGEIGGALGSARLVGGRQGDTGHAQLVEGGADDDLAADDPDGSEDGGALGDDAGICASHVITAAGGDAGEGGDERLFVAQQHQIVPEQIAGQRSAENT